MLHGQLLRTQGQLFHLQTITVRVKRIGNDMIKTVGKYQSCMVSKLRILFKRIVLA